MDVRKKLSTEKRLIDADDFLDLFYVASAGQDKLFIKVVEMVLEDTPTIDAVEVVRCRECKHLMFSDCYGECGMGYMGVVRPDDFCSRGERKEGAE